MSVGTLNVNNRERALAPLFIERAEEFVGGAATGARHLSADAAEPVLHSVCCGLELSLKAIVLHRGGSDERNRAEIRHSLTKALIAAEAAGFDPSPELQRIVRRLSPYYETHSLAELARSVEEDEFKEVVTTAEAHVQAVCRWLAATSGLPTAPDP